MLVERRFMNMNEPVFPFARLTEYEHLQKIFCITFLRWLFTKVPNKFREILFVKEGEKRPSYNIVLAGDEDRYGLGPNCRTLVINLDTLFTMKIPNNLEGIPEYNTDYKYAKEITPDEFPYMFDKNGKENLGAWVTVLITTLVHEVMHSFVLTDFNQYEDKAYMWQIEYLVDARTRDFLYQYESEIRTTFNVYICHEYLDTYLEFARRKYFPGEFVGDKYAQNTKRM